MPDIRTLIDKEDVIIASYWIFLVQGDISWERKKFTQMSFLIERVPIISGIVQLSETLLMRLDLRTLFRIT